ncbi:MULTISPECIES: efflux RND transporter periplasmic adaptor subunit [Rhodanobacter]|uniref:HlyD family efflux transporter periplasmic adaptor subunit n=1 Tax=Rhodanobacter hydrolyticus TaxID=2250595 RepID=A0ABW8J3H3_9GAMM|nr:HlyD family efflux transporter periplasmic adaptor subunit [Rhodanobacter sp. 7MK24]MBD8879355.1 HlyD family efflux transporter periplasmic adaptor subunit [Rhodanobacter sp. 7MK24]
MTPTALRLPSPLRLAGCALAATLALAACSKSAEPPANNTASQYAAVARGRVDIEGGLLTLSMPREGVLANVAVHEGDVVKQGQLLAALDTRPAQLAVDSAQAQLEQAQAQLKLLAVKQAAAKLRAQRLGAAATAGAGDGQSADDAREASNQLDAEQDADQAAADMAAQKLAEMKYELAQRSLRAPFDATVVHVTAQPGASVSPSDALFTLLPDKPRIVRAELNESFVGVVHPGMAAEVSDNDDTESGHWNAHVLRIGQVYGPSTLENDPQTRANARTVECVLAFDQPEQQLRIGQRVIVRFIAADKH